MTTTDPQPDPDDVPDDAEPSPDAPDADLLEEPENGSERPENGSEQQEGTEG